MWFFKKPKPSDADRKLSMVLYVVRAILRKDRDIMAKIDDLVTALNNESQSIDTLATAVAAGTVDPAKLDTALGLVQTNNAKLTALVASLTPPPPPPPPPA